MGLEAKGLDGIGLDEVVWDGVAVGCDGVAMRWCGDGVGRGLGWNGEGKGRDWVGWGKVVNGWLGIEWDGLDSHCEPSRGFGAAGVRALVPLTHYIDFSKSAVSRVVLACPAARTLPLRVFIAGPAPLFSEFRLSFQWPLGFKNLNWELAG